MNTFDEENWATVDTWRRMDTAPKDGTVILLAVGQSPHDFVTCYWVDRLDWQLVQSGSFADDSDVCGEPLCWRAIHPLPNHFLPEPPKPRKGILR